MCIKKERPALRPTSHQHFKNKNKHLDSKVIEPNYCLCIDPDSGLAYMEPESLRPAEKVAIRNYVTSKIGNKSKISRLVRQINRRPYLAEKYIKIH